jgi:hypothetical protein
MDGGREAPIGFVVTRCDAPELLEPLETVLNEMPPFVHLGVVRNGRFAIRLARYDSNRTALVQSSAQSVVVERFVGDGRLRRRASIGSQNRLLQNSFGIIRRGNAIFWRKKVRLASRIESR